MKLKSIITTICLLAIAGCSADQISQTQADAQKAEAVYAATTQATATAKQTMAVMPPDSPQRQQATQVIATAEKGEQTARLALDLAQAALDAASRKDAADPALATAVSRAVSAIPSPWTPILASLLPAAIPLVFSIAQSVKLGRAHQTVVQVTQQLEDHKAALASLTATQSPAATPSAATESHG